MDPGGQAEGGPNDFNGTQLQVGLVIFPIVVIVSISLRVYTRFFLTQTHGWDDVFMLLAGASVIFYVVNQSLALSYGSGRRGLTLTYDEIQNLLIQVYLAFYAYVACVLFTKVSILLLYLRNCSSNILGLRICQVLIGIVVMHVLGVLTVLICVCEPMRRFWDRSVPGHCLNIESMWYANTAIYVFTDFAILFLPLVILKDMTTAGKSKVWLALLLAVGGLACVCSVLRAPRLRDLFRGDDLYWASPELHFWGLSEVSIAIAIACVSTLRPLMARIFPRASLRYLGTTVHTAPTTGNGYGYGYGSGGDLKSPGTQDRTFPSGLDATWKDRTARWSVWSFGGGPGSRKNSAYVP